MPVNFVTRGPTERAISFEAQYVDGILHISGLDERHIQHSYSAIEIYLTYIATRATPENERKCEWVVAGRDRAKFW